jgi:two-component system OmpR family sensor kinase
VRIVGRSRASSRSRTDREEYLSLVLHELRNPLVGIDAAARVLAKDLGAHPAAQRASRVAAEARHLLELLESVADAEAVAGGRLRSILRSVDLGALVRETVGSMHLDGHPLELRGTDASVSVLADEQRIRQVLKNLLANAAQYSPAGARIEVTVGIDARGRDATVEVRDHGPGIPPLERRRLFQRFSRLSTADGTRGSGLGLYISKAIVHDHRGDLRYEESPTGGSAFSFSIPLAKGRSEGRSRAEATSGPARPSAKRR